MKAKLCSQDEKCNIDLKKNSIYCLTIQQKMWGKKGVENIKLAESQSDRMT